jgi:hypothetical protein
MELDDLKGAWAQYDKKLSKNLKLNEELLKSINFEKYNHALKKPMNLELLNIFIQVFMIGLVTVFSIRLSNEILYFLTGLIGALMCTISLIFSAVKANRFNKLFYYHLSVTNFQKDLTHLRILIMRFRKIEYVIAAIIGITLFPLMVKATTKIDLLGNLTVLIPAICCALGFGYAIGIWLNMIVYDKGIKDAEMFLSMVDKFGKEE